MEPSVRPETLEFDRYACITIQGGGVYGLSLLGQLQAVFEHKFIPVALAGTSAGAIVATLFWARLTPEAVLNEFLELAGQERLINLVGPFDSDDDGVAITPVKVDQTVKDVRTISDDLKTTVRDIHLMEERKKRKPGWLQSLLGWTPLVCGAIRLQVNERIKLLRRVHWAWTRRGVFKGETLMNFLNDLLLQAPAVRDNLDLLPDEVRTGTKKLTFRHFADIQERGQGRGEKEEQPYFPPLFLAATEVSTRRLELINSIEPRYQDWPVALAVRASAGFPGFFLPIDYDVMESNRASSNDFRESNRAGFNDCHAGGERCYVDGGMIANFPAFIFGNRFRRWLAYTAPKRFHINVMRAWTHVGLRLTTPRQERPRAGEGRRPETFVSAMMDLFRGLARNELEDRVTEFVPRSVSVELPYPDTGGPLGVLSMRDLRPHIIQTMYDQGLNAGLRCLSPYRFNLPPAKRIEQFLYELLDRAESLFAPVPAGQLKLRSSVLLPQGKEFVLLYRARMDDPEVGPVYPPEANTDRDFRIPITAGLTGLCYIKRHPLLLNLAKFDEVMKHPQKDDSKEDLFLFNEQIQREVRKDRTWLLSVPIFDPEASSPGRLPLKAEKDFGRRYYAAALDPSGEVEETDGAVFGVLNLEEIDGAVFGVLNLDAGWNYTAIELNPEPEEHRRDSRIRHLVDIMRVCAGRIGAILSRYFPRLEKMHEQRQNEQRAQESR